jgi:TonB family protein
VKAFTPPPPPRIRVAKEIKPADLPTPPTPETSVQAGMPSTPNLPNLPRVNRPFTAPPRGPARASRDIKQVDTPSIAAPPKLGNSLPVPELAARKLTVAVVGLKPTEKTALPTTPSPGEFSAGPVVRKEGATTTGDPGSVSVPDIFVRGPRDAKPDLIARAYAPVTSAENIRETMRRAQPNLTPGVAPQAAPMRIGGAIQVSSAPDPVFEGRDVFMLAIQMPNLTSAAGSWLMWYADRNAIQKGLGPVAPPVAHRKVDPKYIATAIEERIEGRVQLACVIRRDGSVGGIELRRGVDDRLNRSAQEALAKWEFSPATRNGVPVDVDVLVEIPFRLEPKVKGPY